MKIKPKVIQRLANKFLFNFRAIGVNLPIIENVTDFYLRFTSFYSVIYLNDILLIDESYKTCEKAI